MRKSHDGAGAFAAQQFILDFFFPRVDFSFPSQVWKKNVFLRQSGRWKIGEINFQWSRAKSSKNNILQEKSFILIRKKVIFAVKHYVAKIIGSKALRIEGAKWSAYTSLLLCERSCLCNSPVFWLLLLVDVAWLVNETWKKSRKTEFSTRRGWKRIINTQNSAPRRCVRVVVCFMIRFREFLGVLEK